MKPRVQKGFPQAVLPANGIKESVETSGGISVEVRMLVSEDNFENETVNWVVENVKFFVKQPVLQSKLFRYLITAACLIWNILYDGDFLLL